jgi:HAD superfamily hydrolase (TIGR01450 family)
MVRVVARTSPLGNVSVLVCDLDGVLYRGARAIPGAGEALQRLEASGIELLFVTNNSTRTAEQTATVIAERTGFPAAADRVITSGLATARWLRDRASTALVVGEEGLEQILATEGVAPVTDPGAAEAVVVGLDRSFDYDRLSAAMDAVRGGAALYATNTDATFPTPDGLRPGGGAIVAAVERACGVDAFVCGKPHEPVRRLIRDLAPAGGIAVVGDRPETDVALGAAEGWPTVLVLSGVTEEGDEIAPAHVPTAVVGSIAEVPDLVGA